MSKKGIRYCIKSFLVVIVLTIFSINYSISLNLNTVTCNNNNNFFIENKGQIINQNNKPNPACLYLLNMPGMNVQLRHSGWSYDLYSATGSWPLAVVSENPTFDSVSKSQRPEVRSYAFHRIDFDLIGFNPNYDVITSDPSSDYLNYYTTGTPVKGITSVRSYRSVIYKNIYQGIDIEFIAEPERGYKYNFIVHPDGRLADIRIKISGTDEILLEGDTLRMKTRLGDVNEVIPETYYMENDVKVFVKAKFSETSKGIYGFSLNKEITGHPTLVIDPTSIRVWGTFYGGVQPEMDAEVLVDQNHNVILCGSTLSFTNIATAGAYDTTRTGGQDCFITKFTTAGVRIWGTYFGGLGGENLRGAALDLANNIYVGGTTTSDSCIATPGSHQDTIGAPSDGYLAKFNSNGWRIWGTYYGGEATDYLYGVATDHVGNVYVAGSTMGSSNLGTTGTYQPNFISMTDGFLGKFDSSGTWLWGTYYGHGCYFESCSVDTSGIVYVTGATQSTDLISSPGAHQKDYGGGNSDVFLVAFTPNGQRLWGTYYGGTSVDGPFSVGGDTQVTCTADNNGFVYLTSYTKSVSGIASVGAYQENLSGTQDGFIAKFNTLGQRIWGTYYGGINADWIFNCTPGSNGDLFFTGESNSPDGIATSGSYMPSLIGGADAFLVKFDSSGQRHWGTYFGGSDWDFGCSIKYIGDDTIYFAGTTYSLDNIASINGHQQTNNGQGDAFLEKFIECWPIDTAGPITGNNSICVSTFGVNYSIPQLPHAVNYIWTLPPGATIMTGSGTTNITVNFSSSSVSGNIWVKGLNKCSDPGDSAYLYVTVHQRPLPVITGPASTCAGPGKVYSTASGMTNYQWSVSAGGSITLGGSTSDNTATITWTVAGNQTISVNYTDANGCQGLAATIYNVMVDPSPAVGVTISAPSNNVCSGTQVTFTAIPSNEGTTPFYQWKVNGINAGTSGTSYTYAPLNGDVVTCVLTSSITGCILNNPATSNAITMTVNPYLPVTISISPSQNPYCAGSTITFTATPNNQGTTPFYQWKVNGVNAGINNPVYSYIPANGDVVTCILNSSVPCPTGNPATSNAVTMVENTNVTVSVSIAPSKNTVCSGTTVLFLATPLNQGTAPDYQWKVNGVNAGTNSPNFSYVPLNGDLVTCKLTSNAPCAAGNPATSNSVIMIVNPLLPVNVSVSADANPVCSGTTVTFTATPVNGGTTPSFQWKVNGLNVGTNNPTYSYIPANNDIVICTLTSSELCTTNNPASSIQYPVSVNPVLPVSLTIAASANQVCSGIAVTYTATPNNGGGTPVYQWKVNGVNAGTNSTTYTYNPVAGDQVLCILNSSIACPIGNPATSNTITMNVGAVPVVTFTTCFDTVTTLNAKPIKLKGGIPLNGTYSGPGVSVNTFNPAIAGIGTKTITYNYINAAFCSASKAKTIIVQAVPAFICGNNLTDIRDGKSYATVQIGGQCWFATDLNYGTMISSSSHQRDNCINEKYCYNDLATNCGDQTYYQWDEIMRYDDTPAQQGLCPPGWHVPTEAEWNTLFSFYINNGFAGSPLKYSGYSGFNALLSGVNHFNRQWDFNNFATFFWSSTAYGSLKAWAHGMNDYNPSVSFYPSSRVNAFSVRCCKD
jgi:uncharacterized protein (TIGR02145 family)